MNFCFLNDYHIDIYNIIYSFIIFDSLRENWREICERFARDLREICERLARDLRETCERLARNL